MEKGFNSDVIYAGTNYHIQTEDWGQNNPMFVSRVFRNGAVVRSFKTLYEDVLPKGLKSSANTIRVAMKAQHEQILDLLVSGQLV